MTSLHIDGYRSGLHTPADVNNALAVQRLETAMRFIRAGGHVGTRPASSVAKHSFAHELDTTTSSAAVGTPFLASADGGEVEEEFTMKLVTIQREGRDPFTRLEGLPCPCCGQTTRVQWLQPSLLPDRPALRQTHCENQACAGYYMTNTPEEFARKYPPPAAAS